MLIDPLVRVDQVRGQQRVVTLAVIEGIALLTFAATRYSGRP